MGQLKFLTDKYKSKIAIVRDFLADNLGVSVSDFVKKAYLPEKATLFLALIDDRLSITDTNYLRTKLDKLGHLKDQRSCEEYALDLVLGWIMEDVVLEILNKLGFKCSLDSKDRNREFLNRPKATPDFKISNPNCPNCKEFKLELAKDYTGFWQKEKKIHLRDNKYNNLKKDNGMLLGIDFINKEFFVVEIKKTKAIHIPRHFQFGGKPAWEFGLANQTFYPLGQMKEVLEKILK